ncbi:cupin domain-containing protein [Novosphingobium sp. ST904]|uniref:(R)-mandelonitrile lyase n=1 Tax=Novosphingobium sp. ST904 TaxID=1684385 RepID=UPI0006C8B6A9|nr:quercetin dioxygenase-like cupin family protein [Novosphingobium sp. ST904]
MSNRAGRTIAALGMACLSVTALAQEPEKAERRGVSVIRAGTGPAAKGPAQNFTGTVRVEGRFQREAPARVGGATVTFEPGAHTAWHTHPLGQTLVVTRGHGFVQEWGSPAQAFVPGDVVWIPPQTKHWHGAAPHDGMTHVAIAEVQDGSSVTWMEPVSEVQYREAVAVIPRGPS